MFITNTQKEITNLVFTLVIKPHYIFMRNIFHRFYHMNDNMLNEHLGYELSIFEEKNNTDIIQQ